MKSNNNNSIDNDSISISIITIATNYISDNDKTNCTHNNTNYTYNNSKYNSSSYNPINTHILTLITHTQGGDAILRNVGKDSSKGFHGPQHPASVWDLIAVFHIGQIA